MKGMSQKIDRTLFRKVIQC